MKRTGQKFNWKTFFEGLSYSVFCFLCTAGVGLGAMFEYDLSDDTNLIAWFYIIIGSIVSTIIALASYDTAWERM